MTTVNDIMRAAQAEVCRPWLRHILPHAEWSAFARASVAEGLVLLAHWADTVQVHALFLDPDGLTIVAISTGLDSGQYPALSPILSAATLYERMIGDLWGHRADGGIDPRAWFNHGNWMLAHPMATRPEPQPRTELTMLDHPDLDEHTILALGPIWGRLDEAAHLRLVLDGFTILRAEARLGFTHKGTLTLMRGKSPRIAARFAARLSADATVAHSVAFARATESAMDVTVTNRAAMLRVVMMEVERVAGHLDNLAEVGRLAEALLVKTHCGLLREKLLRATDAAFGHRLMMDCVVPGGVVADIAEGGTETLLRAMGDIASALPVIRQLHDGPLSLRLADLGRVDRHLAITLGISGVVGRASGHAFDVRMSFMPSYPNLEPRLAVLTGGDAAARQSLRMFEIEESLRLIGAALDSLPDGPVTIALPPVSGEGIACAESIRGDVWHWIRLDHGQIAAVFPRDPGWALWPLAERVLTNALADDLDACDVDLLRASLALPASGMDL